MVNLDHILTEHVNYKLLQYRYTCKLIMVRNALRNLTPISTPTRISVTGRKLNQFCIWVVIRYLIQKSVKMMILLNSAALQFLIFYIEAQMRNSLNWSFNAFDFQLMSCKKNQHTLQVIFQFQLSSLYGFLQTIEVSWCAQLALESKITILIIKMFPYFLMGMQRYYNLLVFFTNPWKNDRFYIYNIRKVRNSKNILKCSNYDFFLHTYC